MCICGGTIEFSALGLFGLIAWLKKRRKKNKKPSFIKLKDIPSCR